ncbi:unnamed protein product, partial [Didymodactylos carnosus]
RSAPSTTQYNVHFDREEMDGDEPEDQGIDSGVTLKRTASLVALNMNENLSENTFLHPSPMTFKPHPLRNTRISRQIGNRTKID